MNILIIGGTRYMGRIAVQRMLERGNGVTVFSRGNTKPEWWGKVEHILGDRNEKGEQRKKPKKDGHFRRSWARSKDRISNSLEWLDQAP